MPAAAPVGYQTFLRIEPPHRVIEVGNILYTPALQRTIGATEAQYLFAAYVFDTLGYRRYEWKCNDSQRALEARGARLGFTFEGVFRQHMIVKGRNRDTAWFSMLDSEWPRAARRLRAMACAGEFRRRRATARFAGEPQRRTRRERWRLEQLAVGRNALAMAAVRRERGSR